jgi:hypothetical protein
LHHGLSWYDVLALASFGFWPVVLPALLALAWLGWRLSRRHWWGWPLLALALAAALLVFFAALDTH